MKQIKSILALVLVACLFVTLFAACAQSEDLPNTTPDTNKPADNTDKPADQGDDKPADTDDPDELSNVSIHYFVSNGFINTTEHVEAAVNAITEEEIGVHVTLYGMELGTYMQQMGVSLAAGDPVDIFERGFGALGFSALCANGQILELSDLLNEHGQGLMEILGPYMGAVTVEGEIYGIPPYRLYNANTYICMRSDILREIGMYEFAEKMTTWAEYEQILAKVKDNYDTLYPYVVTNDIEGTIMGGENFSDSYSYDNCGDTIRLIAGFENNTLGLIADRQDKKDEWARVADWYQNGWVWPDGAFADQMSGDLIKQGVAFSEITLSELGIESMKKSTTGYEMLCRPVVSVAIGTAQVQKFGLSIARQCEDPEAAIKFLNLLYTNKELANIMAWGVEGKDYEMVDGMARYPGGVKDNSNYHADEYAYGNQFILHPWEGTSADFREQAKQNLDAAPISDYLGFSFAPVDLDTEIASLSAVYEEFIPTLSCGGYTEEYHTQFVDKLNKVGLQTYMDAMQTQLDAWLASK